MENDQIVVDGLIPTQVFDDYDESDLLSVGSLLDEDNTLSKPVVEFEFGQSHPDWLQFLGNLSLNSKLVYEKTMFEYIVWHGTIDHSSFTEIQSVRFYFSTIYELKKEDGTPKFAPTRFRTMASIFMAFWKYTGMFF